MRFHDPQLAAEHADLRLALIGRMRDHYSWHDVPCVLCGPDVPTSLHTTKWTMDVRACDGCGHLFVSPRLPEEAVPELYGHAYWDEYSRGIGSPTLADRIAFDHQNGFGKLARDVEPFTGPCRLLDVGASNGGMVRAARERGFAAEGIEPSPETCAVAKDAHGIDLICGDVRTAGLADASFDVVTMHDVLEHVFEPLEILAACRQVLAPGGLLVIETPTTDSSDFLVTGDDWSDLSPLEHVHLFSEANLARALERCGFAVIDLYCPHENNVIAIAEARREVAA
ncbi:MAG TPA: class I SAM-dependent methyltransferase [Acidimicrobiales bacterium]|nr:class I SAM-dependent methyltransferase [Acidimicrobiales bacterium]